MGQKSTKHSDADGDPSPSPRKSPKRSPRKTGKPSERERTPPRTEQGITDKGGGYSDVIAPVSKSVTYSTPDPKSDTRSSGLKGTPPRGDHPMDKENVPRKKMDKPSPRTPSKMSTKDQQEPLTPIIVNNEVVNHIPQATSTPAPNGFISTGESVSPPMSPISDEDHTDQSDDEAFTPDGQFHGRSASPSTVSLASQSTTSSARRSQSCLMHSIAGMCMPAWFSKNSNEDQDSFDRRSEVNYGRFYTTSYLQDGKHNYLKKASLNPNFDQKSPHFHRPANFSYSKDTPEFLKAKKSGMAQLATGTKVVVRRTRRASSPADLKNDEAIRMSMFPGGKPSKPNEIAKIEREDWPGPPSLAAILPDIMRERRKSRGEAEEDDEDEGPQEDPKIVKEIEEISKFKDTSGIGRIIYKELEERKVKPYKPLDPWKASRVPSADHEPRYHTRYQSPMFASPSRFLDRPRRSWDDSDIRRGYRTMSTLANFPVPKPGYGSYGLVAKAATLPVSGMFGGPLDFRYYDFNESTHDESRHHRGTYTSTSTVNTEKSYGHQSSIHDGPGVSLLTFQRSTWHTEVEPEIYPYERLKITNFDLPRDVDRNVLEIHLSDDEFYSIFKMNKEEFHRLAQWKQNDLKRKVDLF